jgi:hypothetical protein
MEHETSREEMTDLMIYLDEGEEDRADFSFSRDSKPARIIPDTLRRDLAVVLLSSPNCGRTIWL